MRAKSNKNTKQLPVARPQAKRTYISQTEIPKHSLQEAIRLAAALHEHFNGDAVPHELANAIGISPTSTNWQSITGAAVAYGLTDGAYNAQSIKLAELGRRIVAPETEGDDFSAKREAVLRPRILKQFFEKYNRGKFPQETIGVNVLVSMGVPRDRAPSVYSDTLESGKLTGIVTDTKSGLYVALSSSTTRVTKAPDTEVPPAASVGDASVEEAVTIKNATESSGVNVRVFITHGKNKQFVDQLKEILLFGKFEPVVAIEHETPSKPVPDKVMDDMRSCFAAVIHVDSEQELIDNSGGKVRRINDNVLIEIGAALALYDRNFVLLVKRGVTLPSNLQGLYCCFYDGDKLDYEATMKLLKAFNEFER